MRNTIEVCWASEQQCNQTAQIHVSDLQLNFMHVRINNTQYILYWKVNKPLIWNVIPLMSIYFHCFQLPITRITQKIRIVSVFFFLLVRMCNWYMLNAFNLLECLNERLVNVKRNYQVQCTCVCGFRGRYRFCYSLCAIFLKCFLRIALCSNKSSDESRMHHLKHK